jgi:hypothetical protein
MDDSYSDEYPELYCFLTRSEQSCGNSSGIWQRTKTVNECAAKNASSLASVFHFNQNSFWVSTFLGNDASPLSNLAFGPGRKDAAASLA